MKKNYKKTLLISVITLASSLSALAQQTTVIRKEWLATNGAVDTIPYTATTLDNFQNVVIPTSPYLQYGNPKCAFAMHKTKNPMLPPAYR